MSDRHLTRRALVQELGLAAGAAWLSAGSVRASEAPTAGRPHVACNQYPWLTFYRRQGRDFNASLDMALAEVAASGVDGFEPLATAPDEIDQLAPLLKKHGLEMRSLYVNSVLHQHEQADQSIAQVLAIAERAKQAAGTRIIVTNPSPIRWGGSEDKNDAQLLTQAAALDKLGGKLKSMGMVLSYHNHDIELRNAAREFHHMMLGTDPELVTLCLDAHWIYRGSGDSAVALFDVLKMYGPRITELHLRQSEGGVWTETLGDGDIDYPRLAAHLLSIRVMPHLVIEQAVEKDTPDTMDAVQSHRRGCQYARRVFKSFAS
jgi:inosose dehydratase